MRSNLSRYLRVCGVGAIVCLAMLWATVLARGEEELAAGCSVDQGVVVTHGDAFGIGLGYVNRTTERVGFTATHNTNVFFGVEGRLAGASVAGGTGVEQNIEISTIGMPIGIDRVTITITSGGKVIGSCAFSLEVLPVGTDPWQEATGPLNETNRIVVPVKWCAVKGSRLAAASQDLGWLDRALWARSVAASTIYLKAGTRIDFRSAMMGDLASNTAASFPIIEDPVPPSAGGIGVEGDIEMPMIERDDASPFETANVYGDDPLDIHAECLLQPIPRLSTCQDCCTYFRLSRHRGFARRSRPAPEQQYACGAAVHHISRYRWKCRNRSSPAALGYATTFSGAELVTMVTVIQNAGGPTASGRVWQFSDGQFTELPAVGIQASIETAMATNESEEFAASDTVHLRMSDQIASNWSAVLRFQAIAFDVGGASVDQLPDGSNEQRVRVAPHTAAIPRMFGDAIAAQSRRDGYAGCHRTRCECASRRVPWTEGGRDGDH